MAVILLLGVVSFAGFAPAENPQIACLVIVDDPIDAHGGATAGPVFQKIMEDSLRYLEVPKDVTITPTEAIEEVAVPAMPDNNPMNAIEAIKAVGLTPIVETQGEVLYTFVPAEGTKVQKSGNVYLYCGPAEGTQVVMPSLYGRTIKEVDRILSGLGLSGTMNGSGLCVGQSIEAGQVIEKGTALIVDFGTTVPDTTDAITEQDGDLTEDNTITDVEDSAESTTNSATVDSQQIEETEPIWD